jgi:monoterpene epsilon-lactone hydrolase
MISLRARLVLGIFHLRKLFKKTSPELDVAQERDEAEAFSRTFKPIGKVIRMPVDAGGVPAEWVLPEGEYLKQVILFAHGGSYHSGSITSHFPLTANLAVSTKMRLLNVGYRLAPEHPFPAALEDVQAAYQWLLAEGISSRQVILAGDSAGGGLILALLVALRDASDPLPAAAVCLSPWTDLTCSGESWQINGRRDVLLDREYLLKSAKLYTAAEDPHHPLISPLFADLHGLPPILIQVGSHEALLSDSTELTKRAQAAGVNVTLEVWEQMQHEWQYVASVLPEGRQALANIEKFLSLKL